LLSWGFLHDAPERFNPGGGKDSRSTHTSSNHVCYTHVRERLRAVVCEKHQADAFANSIAKNHHPPDQRPRAFSHHIWLVQRITKE